MRKTWIFSISLLAVLVLIIAMGAGTCGDGETAPPSEPTSAGEPAIQYDLYTSVSPDGSGSITPDSANYDAGTVLKLTAIPASGYAFDHWSGDAVGTSSTVTVIINSDKIVTANFVAAFALNISVSPESGGSISLSPDDDFYEAGTEVTLTATAEEGYTFDSWGGDAAGGVITTTIIMDANKNVTASFRNLLAEGILFEDYFDDNRNNWGTDSYIENSALHLQLSASGATKTLFMYKWPVESPNYPNFGYEIDMTVIEVEKAEGRGIVFLGDPAQDIERHWFLFTISDSGYYSLYYHYYTIADGSRYHAIVDWTASDFINKGNSTNTLKVICRYSVIELYVNGHLLKKVHGEFPANIGSNGIGLFVKVSEGTTHLIFDNMKMWVLD